MAKFEKILSLKASLEDTLFTAKKTLFYCFSAKGGQSVVANCIVIPLAYDFLFLNSVRFSPDRGFAS